MSVLEQRFLLQLVTLGLIVVCLALMAVMVWRGRMAWRVAILPGLVLAQLAVFYTYVLTVRPEPSAVITFWSASLRVLEVSAFLVVLVVYWRRDKWMQE